MRKDRHPLLAGAAALGLALAAPGAARADTFAQSVLAINHFRLSHSSGGPVAESADKHFLQFGAPPALPGSFAYADQYLAGAQALTRADGGQAGMRSVGTFAFALGAGDTLTVSFDATALTEATLRDPLGPDAQAAARLAWRISMVDLTSGLGVFSFAPEQPSGQGALGRASAEPGSSRYNPGTLTFNASTPFFGPNRSYQMAIHHDTLADPMQRAGAVPAPASLALLGLGLLALATLRRRTR